MDSSKLIMYMIFACVIFIILIVLAKPLKYVVKFALKSILGILGFIVINWALAVFNIYVGINVLTVFVVGLLGVPGLISLYIISAILYR